MILRLEKKYNFHFQKISFSTTRKTVIRDIAVRSCRFLYHFVCDFGAFSAREKKPYKIDTRMAIKKGGDKIHQTSPFYKDLIY